jgi:hypothetical protein
MTKRPHILVIAPDPMKMCKVNSQDVMWSQEPNNNDSMGCVSVEAGYLAIIMSFQDMPHWMRARIEHSMLEKTAPDQKVTQEKCVHQDEGVARVGSSR